MEKPLLLDLHGQQLNAQRTTVLKHFDDLKVGETLTVTHPNTELQKALEAELAGAMAWTDDAGAVLLTKNASTALPRKVGRTDASAEHPGSVWKLEPGRRGLDSNVIVLPPGGHIKEHTGPDLDVLIVVLEGTGMIETEGQTLTVESQEIVWFPARSVRSIVAGSKGLRYFSVHQRKQGLTISGRLTGRPKQG